MNNVTLIGRLTKDPELKTTQSGISFCCFTVAVDRAYGKDKEKQTDFISCTAWRGTADFIGKYFGKGQRIALTGSIQTGSYTDKDGRTVYTTDVNVQSAEFCESRKSENAQTPHAEPAVTYDDSPEDDYPF